jgi:transcriptional regulator with XRE-family HTH domain
VTEVPAESVGGRIRAKRLAAGMSLTELADTAGVSKSYLSNLETKIGHQKPSGETLYAIAKALNTTMSALLGKRLLTTDQTEVDDTLRRFARKAKLGEAELQMLASIKWRGERPRTLERWQFVYDALKASTSLDH